MKKEYVTPSAIAVATNLIDDCLVETVSYAEVGGSTKSFDAKASYGWWDDCSDDEDEDESL